MPDETTRYCYTIEFLRAQLGGYEERYGMPSEEFYDAYVLGTEPSTHFFDRIVWADTYEEYVRLSDLPRPVSRSHPRTLQPVG